MILGQWEAFADDILEERRLKAARMQEEHSALRKVEEK